MPEPQFSTSWRRRGVIQSDQGFSVSTPRRYELVYAEEPDTWYKFAYETLPGKHLFVYPEPVQLADGSIVKLDDATLNRVLENIQKAFEWREFTVEVMGR